MLAVNASPGESCVTSQFRLLAEISRPDPFTRSRVCFQLATFRPVICFIVMVEVTEQQTALRFVDDDANVSTNGD